jgi:hypothetical protein
MTPALEREIAQAREWLVSPAVKTLLADDPYWPKWEGPWWAMTLLWELGRAEEIPPAAARAMVDAINRHYEREFPASEAEVKPGKDYYRDYGCFCMVGTMMQVLRAAGLDPDREAAWLRSFLLRYRLADGGWNCDAGKLTSSFLSTVIAAEALVHCTARELTQDEAEAVDGAAEYLQRRSLCRSLRKQRVADPTWLMPHFPRFYDYDILRGLSYLAAWSQRRDRSLDADAIRDSVLGIDRFFADGSPVFRDHLKIRTLRHQAAGEWERQPAASTALIDLTADPAIGRTRLLAHWSLARPVLVERAGTGF